MRRRHTFAMYAHNAGITIFIFEIILMLIYVLGEKKINPGRSVTSFFLSNSNLLSDVVVVVVARQLTSITTRHVVVVVGTEGSWVFRHNGISYTSEPQPRTLYCKRVLFLYRKLAPVTILLLQLQCEAFLRQGLFLRPSSHVDEL